MRAFSRAITVPAGKLWPDVDGSAFGLQIPHFRWLRIENRAASGSGNDLWVSFDAPPNVNDPGSATLIVPAGTSVTHSIASELDRDGSDEAAHAIRILNIGAATVNGWVELDLEPIYHDVRAAPFAGSATSPSIVRLEDGATAQLATVGFPGDAVGGAVAGPFVGAQLLVYNPNTGSFERQRTPSTFKTVVANALGNTIVWTPAVGKRFRLMRYSITVTANASLAVAGLEEITLNDAGAAIGLAESVALPNAAGAGVALLDTGWRDIGNGYVSTAINQSLQVNLGTALATGEVRVNVAGTEE